MRLACSIPVPSDAGSFYRGLGPLARLTKSVSDLELVLPPRGTSGGWDLGWDWLAQCDALFMYRPHTLAEVQCAEIARSLGLKIWMDWDDDLRALRPCHPKYEQFQRPEVVKALNLLPHLADHISASTEYLLDKVTTSMMHMSFDGALVRVAAKAHLIRNAQHWSFPDRPRKRVISWRGFGYHEEDMELAFSAIQEIVRDFPDWSWVFLGEPYWKVKELIPMDKQVTFGRQPIFQYMEAFHQVASWVHIVPLVDNSFNRAKSNVSWLEASAVGSQVIGRAWPEWPSDCMGQYADSQSFAMVLRETLEAYTPGIPSLVRKSRQVIAEAYGLDQANEKREAILRDLIGSALSGAETPGGQGPHKTRAGRRQSIRCLMRRLGW